MNLSALAQLAARDLQATRGRAVISAVGIGIGVGVLMVIVGLGLGTRDVVLKEVVRQLPVDKLSGALRRGHGSERREKR